MRKIGLFCWGSLGAMLLTACAPDLLTTYSVTAGGVKTDCGDYLVGDNAERQSLLLTAYAGNAVKLSFCQGRKTVLAGSADTGLLAQEGAEEYLRRYRSEACRVTGGKTVDPIHSEFTYSCPLDPSSGKPVLRRIPIS